MSVKQIFNTSAELDYPTVLPTLDLDFANSKTLDPRITFTRSSGGSYVGADGLIKLAGVNEARFDHDPVTGESLGLLIEEARTNLTRRSEDLTEYSNTRVSNITITNGGPFGTGYHEKTITELGHPYNFHTTNQISLTTGQTITFSIFFKNISIDPNEIYLRCWSGEGRAWTTNRQVRYNLSNLTATDSTGTIVNKSIQAFPDGWYRLSMTVTADRNGFAAESIYFLNNNIIGTKYEIAGAQVEAGAFPTSYIPTIGSTRTRAADNASITGKNFSDFYNPILAESEGITLYVESRVPNPSLNWFRRLVSINYNNNNQYRIEMEYSGSIQRARTQTPETGQVVLANTQYDHPTKDFASVKATFGVKYYNTFLATNGGYVFSVNPNFTYSYPFSDVDRLYIGASTSGFESGKTNGCISSIKFWNRRLPNEQLIALTE